MKIVVWQATLTEHQAHTLLELSKLFGGEIEFIVGKDLIVERKAQGWTPIQIGNLHITQLSGASWLRHGIKIINQNKNALHIFDSMWGDRRLFPLMIYAQLKCGHTALITEPYADKLVSYYESAPNWRDALKLICRPYIYQFFGRIAALKTSMVFAISSKARNQFKEIGFTADTIFPFGYFIPPIAVTQKVAIPNVQPGSLRLVFVGSLIARKGLLSLIEAYKKCKLMGLNISLDLYGSGSVAMIGLLPEGAQYCGVIPFGHTQEIVHEYDILILPSLHDGWGVVVNEALLQGIPVITTDAVGSKVLVEKSGAGAIYPASDIHALVNILTKLCDDSNLLSSWKSSAEYFQDLITSSAAATYMYQCINYAIGSSSTRPKSPWYE